MSVSKAMLESRGIVLTEAVDKERKEVLNKIFAFFRRELKSKDITLSKGFDNGKFVRGDSNNVYLHMTSTSQITTTIILYALGFYYFSNATSVTQAQAKKYIDQAKDRLNKELSEFVGYQCDVTCPEKSVLEKYVISVKVNMDKAISEGVLSNAIDKAAERKEMIEDLELEYDKKFNGFCLAISSYDETKLESALKNKKDQLNEVKEAIKTAEGNDKIALKIKADYLKNACDACTAKLKKYKK